MGFAFGVGMVAGRVYVAGGSFGKADCLGWGYLS